MARRSRGCSRTITMMITMKNRRRFPTLVMFALFLIATFATATAVSVRAAENAGQSSGKQQNAVFAGGCFWGVDAVFKHVKGVDRVVSGYARGGPDTANYETVSTGTTGHAESVEVTYDPSKI